MDKKERYERYKYLTGLSSWEVASFSDKDFVVILNDGPSGLRKPLSNDFTNQKELIQTVCLPTPSALASSFDRKTVYDSSSLIALECLKHSTDILLAPGINIKHYVLCGRNFEYFSEDPYLTGALATYYVKGLEDNNVGACLKHYACNSQEFARTINSSEVSLRALNEIYLRSFKYVLKNVSPTAIMTSYNKVNGEYVNESSYLINKKLKEEYRFQGLIMSDWCAISNKGKSIKTGVSLEMPKTKMSNEYIDRGYGIEFNDADLINRDKELYSAIKKFKNRHPLDELDLSSLHQKAVAIADKTIVLAKNENYLPLKKEEKILVLGYFANHNRFVGNGSGFVNAYKQESFLEILRKNRINYEFLQCYDEENINISKDDLLAYKNKFDKVLLFLGQYQFDESEGVDRSTINLREQQIKTLELVKKVFDDFATVLITGSVVNVKDIYDLSSSLMISYLAGEGQSEAIFNNLYGIHNPSGRLPETWISDIKQNPIIDEFLRKDPYYTYFDDDIYVGYRYYDQHENGFLLPFGYGLSYSSFKYENIRCESDDKNLIISFDVKNNSDIDGEDVIEVFVGKKDSSIYRPEKELKGFKKVFVRANSGQHVSIPIEIDDLKSYQVEKDAFALEDGQYQIYIAKNSKEIIDVRNISLKGEVFEDNPSPKKLFRNLSPKQITLDSPAKVLLNNDDFKLYVNEHNLPIDLSDFDNRYSYIADKALRVTLGDEDLKISFEEMESLINYLNKKKGEKR